MSFTGLRQITTAQIGSQYSTNNDVALGTIGADRRGDLYAWTLNGAVALSAGKAVIAPAKVSNDTNRSLDSTSNVAVGSTKVTVSSAGTVTADQYAGGFLVVNDGAGVGQTFLITGNSADYTGGAAHAVDVYIHDSVGILLSTSTSKVALMTNPWANVIVHPGSSVAYQCVGVPQMAVTAAYYFWAKVRGMASVLSDGVITKGGDAILTSNAVAGALLAKADDTSHVVGTAPEATVDTKYYGIYLTLI